MLKGGGGKKHSFIEEIQKFGSQSQSQARLLDDEMAIAVVESMLKTPIRPYLNAAKLCSRRRLEIAIKMQMAAILAASELAKLCTETKVLVDCSSFRRMQSSRRHLDLMPALSLPIFDGVSLMIHSTGSSKPHENR